MAVFRNFYRIITTAVFALVMCVGLTNVYGAGVQCASSTCLLLEIRKTGIEELHLLEELHNPQTIICLLSSLMQL